MESRDSIECLRVMYYVNTYTTGTIDDWDCRVRYFVDVYCAVITLFEEFRETPWMFQLHSVAPTSVVEPFKVNGYSGEVTMIRQSGAKC